jgi:hypothetical protein
MPTIAIVDGVKIMMYANDHPPAHFHALFAEYRAVIDIGTLKLVRGQLPSAKRGAIVKWAAPRRAKLLHAWDMTQAHFLPARVL